MKTMTINAPERGTDKWGRGDYMAPRGFRKHKGVDFACYPGSEIISLTVGHVSKLGYPYAPSDDKKGDLRYVEVTDRQGRMARYFYVDPRVVMGQPIKQGDVLGVSQTLQNIYPGITDHVHFEVKTANGYANPLEYLDAIKGRHESDK